MMVFPCQICRTPLSANESQAGQLVRCPTCLSTQHVPASAAAAVSASTTAWPSPAPGVLGAGTRPRIGRRYGFNCGYCSSRLEATESMAAQDGQCPTCGNQITVPILDRYNRLIDPKTRQIIRQDPHPVHAYAAAGERAPGIRRNRDGQQVIVCSRCSAVSPITANNCKQCGMPFTMEGTTIEATSANNGFCVASFVLGIIAVFTFCAYVIPPLAVIFGVIGLIQTNVEEGAPARGRNFAIAGLVLGGIGCILSAMHYFNVF